MEDGFDDFEPDLEVSQAEPRPDPKVNQASGELLEFIEGNPDEVFYEMQLEVLFEDRYFHWITSKALAELRDSRKIGSSIEPLREISRIRFYFHIKNRYWKRKASEVRKLVGQFSDPAFTSALGNQGEMLTDAALPSVGFLPKARNANEFGGIQWNVLSTTWIESSKKMEFSTARKLRTACRTFRKLSSTPKLQMCETLRLRPLFIARMMPRSYVFELFKRGGFALLMKFSSTRSVQNYSLRRFAVALVYLSIVQNDWRTGRLNALSIITIGY